jgi:drug/metabolite transporter (DMT)-like permease
MQYAYPLLAIFIWAGNTVVNKLAVGSIFPSEIGFYRWLLAALLFTPFMLKPVIAHWAQIRPNLGKIVILGVLGMAVLQHGVNLGDAMMLVATLAYAVYSTLLKKWQLRLPPLVLLYLQILVAVVVLFPLFLFSAKTGLSWANIPLVLYACLLASMLAPLAWMHSVKTLGPSRTTLFFNLLPLITALIAAVVLKEELALYHLVGGLLTLGGVILSERWTTPVRRRA